MKTSNNYRFQLKIDGGNFSTVRPNWVGKGRIVSEQQKGQQYKRDKINGALMFYRNDFETINSASVEAEFVLRLEKQVGGSFVAQSPTIKFYKHDCFFDKNAKQVTLNNFESFDGYDKFEAALNKEVNLFDLAPQKTPIKYKKQGVLQIAFPGSALISNFTNGYYYELPCTPFATAPSDHNDMVDLYGFGVNKDPTSGLFDWIFGVIQGVGDDLSPDISGLYYCQDYTAGGDWLAGQGVGFKHVTENYYIETGVGSPAPVVVRDAPLGTPGTILYQGIAGEKSVNSPYHQGNGTELISQTDPASKAKFYAFKPYVRLLTNKEEIDGTATVLLPDDDPFPHGTYTRALPIETANFIYQDAATVAPTSWPKVDEAALHYAGRYFTKPTTPTDTFIMPVLANTWTAASAWFYLDAVLLDLLEQASESFTVKDAYKLADVLKVVLSGTGTELEHGESETYSSFLYSDGTNAIRGAKKIPVIVPVTNITIGEYDRPAKKTPIRLSEIMQLFDFFYYAFPYISGSLLKVEQWEFFNNGHSYTGEQVGIDCTTLKNPQASRHWINTFEGYTYDKQDLPERIETGWAADCSRPFEGHPIDILSKFVQKGEVRQSKISRFIADIDFALTNPGAMPTDGFFFLECIEGADGLEVPFADVVISPDETFKLQNGYASFAYAQNQYLRYGLPALNVKINKQVTTALSVERSKSETGEMPSDGEIEQQKLIKTREGSGRIQSIERDLESDFVTFKLKHKIY